MVCGVESLDPGTVCGGKRLFNDEEQGGALTVAPIKMQNDGRENGTGFT
jgi:hypothetical protein